MSVKLHRHGANISAIVTTVTVAVLAYLNALSGGFVHDDVNIIQRNPWITDLGYIPELFFTNAWAFEGTVSNFYRPLAFLAYMGCYYAFGLDPWGFHLANLALHAIVSALVYLLAVRVFRSEAVEPLTPYMLALAAALIFAVHPIHVEAVAWVSGIMDLLYSMFFLLSFYFYIGSKPGWNTHRAVSLTCFFLAALSKETALTLPIMFLAYDLLISRNLQLSLRGLWQLFTRYLPYACVGVTYLVMRVYALGGFAPRPNDLDLGPYDAFINIFPLFAQYLEKLVLPINLNVYHGFDPIASFLTSAGLLSMAIFLAYGFLLWWLYRRSRKGAFFLLWLIVPLLPVFYLPALGENPFSERYLYLPSVGFVMLVVMGMRLLSSRPATIYGGGTAWFVVMASIIISAYAVATIARNEVWASNISLWEDTVRKSPEEFPVQINLASAYYEAKRYDEALSAVKRALALNPRSGEALYGLGSIYFEQDKMTEAIDALKLALSADPSNPVKHYHLGAAYAKSGMDTQAMNQFRQSVALNPDYAVGYFQIGLLYAKQMEWKAAAFEFERAVRIEPGYAEAHLELGKAYESLGELDRAMQQLQTAVRLDPSLGEAQ